MDVVGRGCDPNNQATEEMVATFTGSTYVSQAMTMPETSTRTYLAAFPAPPTPSVAGWGRVSLIFDDGSTD